MGVIQPSEKDDLERAGEGEDTGVPLFRTWGAVYALVLGAFALSVVLLTWFTVHFTRVVP